MYAIKTAKVPIVKFCVDVGGKSHAPATTLEGDISFYNVLAIENSTMLSTYAMIDHRVRSLGYCLKVFAKVCLLRCILNILSMTFCRKFFTFLIYLLVTYFFYLTYSVSILFKISLKIFMQTLLWQSFCYPVTFPIPF